MWDPPLGPGQAHIVPLHGQHLCASRTGQERGQQDRADSEVRLIGDGLKKPGEFLGLDEPIARFLSKHLDACGGILTIIQAPVPSQIEHLPEQGHQTIGAIGRRLSDLRMEAGHIIPIEVREFPRAKDREMGIQHRPIIAAGAFARRMPFQILLAQVPKRRLMDLILSDLCRIGTLRDCAYMRGRQFARLIHRERSIGPIGGVASARECAFPK
jgi:hypothetical protein